MLRIVSCLCAALVCGVVMSAQDANAVERGRSGFGASGGVGIGEKVRLVPSLGFVISPPSVYDPYAPYYSPRYDPDPPYVAGYSITPNVGSQLVAQSSRFYCDDPAGYYPSVRTCDHPWLKLPSAPPSTPGS